MEKPSGVEGWLAVFALGQIFFVLSGLMALWSDVIDLMTWTARGMVAVGIGPGAIAVYDLTLALLVGGALLLLVLLLRRHPATPRVALYVLGFGALAYGAQAVLLVVTTSGLPANVAGDSGVNELGLSAGRGMIYSLVWFLYWRKSKRVRATFGWDGKARGPLGVEFVAAIRRSGLIAGSVVASLALVAAVVGGSRARELKSSLAAPPSSPDAPFDADAVLAAAVRAQGGNFDSLARAQATDGTDSFRSMIAQAVVTHLAPAERREIAQLRGLILDRIPTDSCAEVYRTGSGLMLSVLSNAESRRLLELSGTAIGRQLSGRYPGDLARVPQSRAQALLLQYSTASDLQVFQASGRQDATAETLCTAMRGMYRVLLEIPAGTADERDGIYYLVDMQSGRSP